MNKKYIQKIVKASGVKTGELVLVNFWGEDSDKWIANEFMVSIAALGATPFLLQESRTINRDIFSNATDDCYGEKYFSIFSNFDAVLDVVAYQPVVLGYKIAAEKFERYRNYMSRLFPALLGAKRFAQIRIPTKANAEEAQMGVSEYVHRMESAYDIDYEKLLDTCNEAIYQIKDMENIVLCSGDDCRLYFDLTGRRWHIDAGDGDLPCGEIYIAPNENLTNGTVFFEQLFIENVGVYVEVKLYVEDGIVIGSDNMIVDYYLQTLSRENKIVCELGLGMNPNVFNLCGYTMLDEKMADSFHIAIGANYMFGGNNIASMHVDFVGTGDFKIRNSDLM